MLCYASLAYMPWPEGLRRDNARKRKFEWFASIWSLIAMLWPSLYIFQSWVLDWTESPITNRESAAGCNRISKTKNWSRGQDSGWKERGEATTTACMFGRGSALRMTFWVLFLFLFLRKFHKFHSQAGSTGPLQLRGIFYFCKNWHLFFIFCNKTSPDPSSKPAF